MVPAGNKSTITFTYNTYPFLFFKKKTFVCRYSKDRAGACAGLVAPAGVPAGDQATAAQDLRRSGRAAGDSAEGEAQGREAPGVPGDRRAPGRRHAQDRLHPRLRLLQARRAPGVAGPAPAPRRLRRLL